MRSAYKPACPQIKFVTPAKRNNGPVLSSPLNHAGVCCGTGVCINDGPTICKDPQKAIFFFFKLACPEIELATQVCEDYEVEVAFTS